jgi:hypothetical protein
MPCHNTAAAAKANGSRTFLIFGPRLQPGPYISAILLPARLPREPQLGEAGGGFLVPQASQKRHTG